MNRILNVALDGHLAVCGFRYGCTADECAEVAHPLLFVNAISLEFYCLTNVMTAQNFILALGGALILDEASLARHAVGLLAEFCNLVGTLPDGLRPLS